MKTKSYECCIFGAGPAGLGAAIELAKEGVGRILIVDRNRKVGGLSRTESFDGALFDVGPHRFYTTNKEIRALWEDLLKDDFRPVARLTRIYYKRRYFQYPVKPLDVLANLGMKESAEVIFSFLQTQMRRQPDPKTFEDWVVGKFGRKLYETFFKSYTEKIWGIPCTEIEAQWAAQRIRGLDFGKVLKDVLVPWGKPKARSLVHQFHYPRLGAGQMYEAMLSRAMAAGAEIMLATEVVRFNHRDNQITSAVLQDEEGRQTEVSAGHYFNSIPLTHFFKRLNPAPEGLVQDAVNELYYREHITVNLLLGTEKMFGDQWLYIHSPDVRVARIANYNNFSGDMVGKSGKTALSMEYFSFKDEDLWKLSDNELKKLAIEELALLGLGQKSMVENAWVVRETESYPVYYRNYQIAFERLKSRINAFKNLSPIGRGGMYKYNNQDHSTLSGLFAVRNFLKTAGSPYSVWGINDEQQYLEEGGSS